MGFYLRKSFSFGPLRLNLSRSGLGASVGIKGARVGLGPRGSYVHAGREGLYYRRNLNARESNQFAPPARKKSSSDLQPSLQAIDSSDIGQMTPSSGASLIQVLNQARKYTNKLPVTLVVCLIPYFFLVAQRAHWWTYTALSFAVLPFILWVRHIDVTRGTAVIDYELDQSSNEPFQKLVCGFHELLKSKKTWHISASGALQNWKTSGGATQALKRSNIRPSVELPKWIVCNIEIPNMSAGEQHLLFFPEALFVADGKQIGAISYEDLQATLETTKFLEEENVPSDARIIGETWKYVNKQGGPDRRFKDNHTIPVVEYGQLHLTSSSGLNELFQCSNPTCLMAFGDSLEKFKKQTNGQLRAEA